VSYFIYLVFRQWTEAKSLRTFKPCLETWRFSQAVICSKTSIFQASKEDRSRWCSERQTLFAYHCCFTADEQGQVRNQSARDFGFFINL